DWVPPFTVLLTAANGESIIHETIYPNRLDFIPELKKMGAEIELFNPKIGAPEAFYNFNPEDDDPSFFHAAKIFGPTPLVGTKIDASDSPAAAALLVAALCAKGTSEISGTEHLKAGYENIVEKLKALGAKIEEE
ncbi:MAG: UDP-N-acetylglucosamine 1-carboxyvinyltransferase, partial [Candidatus Cloacimonetes bacterium]|nr:UDP-N-acetylglucosamine 1-carboxyvinyltransferase [Candidatus Cloacimonadota bacterium]